MSTTICPDCAEQIEAMDVACRFCGARLRSLAPPGAVPAAATAVAVPAAVAPPSVNSPSSVTVGSALGRLSIGSGIALFGALVVAAGSLGPWVDTVFASVSGTRGDGKYTLAAAVVAATFTLLLSSPSGGTLSAVLALLAGLGAGAIGVIDLRNVNDKVHSATLFGHQIATVGWGLYAVIGGAVLVVLGVASNATR